MSLRKTKPLRRKRTQEVHDMVKPDLWDSTVSPWKCVPYDSGPHGVVVGPLLLHRLLQTAVDEP